MIKNKRLWRKLVLTLLIMLSFLMSLLLFSSGGHLGEGVTDQTNIATNQPSPSVVERDMIKDVYRPAQMTLHTARTPNTKYVVKDNDLADRYLELLGEIRLHEVAESYTLTTEEYQNMLSSDLWLECVFNDQLPMGIYSEMFDNLPTDYAEQTFDRFFIQTQEATDIYFYDYQTQTVYRTPIEKKSAESFPQLDSLESEIYSAYGVQLKERWIYLPIQEQEIQRRSYMADQLPNSLYINQFFKDTSSVESRVSGSLTRYIDLTKEVSINDTTHVLTFLSQQPSSGEMSRTQRMRSSYDTLTRLENWQDRVVYQSYNPNNHYVTYQRQISGLPVFSDMHLESTVEIAMVEAGLTHLRLPLRFIRTPINISGDDQTNLASGQEVIEKLESAGIVVREEIQDLKIGLEWSESAENEAVIFFEPHWYVKYQNQWQRLDQLLSPDEEDDLSVDNQAKGGRFIGF